MCNNKEMHPHGEHHEHTDSHDHEHSHDHGNEHQHAHPHTHGEEGHCKNHGQQNGEHCCGKDIEKKDIEILSILLDHWVTHNQDHAMEYNTWVEKMNRLGKNEVAEDIIEAMALMAEADKHLIAAKKDLLS
ncbi:MAG: hypothetical protein ACOH15_01575 [Acetobacterium sp.]